VFEGVFGINTDKDVGDILAHEAFKGHKDWLSFEVPLMSTKWFDYRQLTPVQATYLFADRYREAFKQNFRRYVDYARADYVKALRREDLFKCEPTIVSGIWRARQHADAMGIPYEDYLADALNRAMRVHREFLPKPTQLYTDAIVEYVQERWEQRQRAKLYVAESDLYMNQNYLGLPAQNAHHEWLFTQAELRPDRAQWLNRLVYLDQRLPEEKVIARYEPDLVREIQEYA
jgi:hypothetical protein